MQLQIDNQVAVYDYGGGMFGIADLLFIVLVIGIIKIQTICLAQSNW